MYLNFKKIIIIFSIGLLLAFSNVLVFADTKNNSTLEIIKYDDGSYLEIYTELDNLSTYATNTRTGSKVVNYRKDTQILWYVKLSGTFTYNGKTSTCTSTSITGESYSSSWKLSGFTSNKSGNTAYGQVTATHYYGIIGDKTTHSISLTCNANGDLI